MVEKSIQKYRIGLCGLILLLPSLSLAQQVEPVPAIVVSRQTTYVTEPLLADGLPDYEKYVLTLSRDHVTAENNAAVLLWQAMWPGQIEPADFAPFCRELGLPTIPSVDAALKPLYSDANNQRILNWLREKGQADTTIDSVDLLLNNALARPWKGDDFPPLSNWVKENSSVIDRIVVASRRSQYYSPSPSLLNNVQETLFEMLMPGPLMLRDAAKALAIRAMNNLGEGRIDEAWTDVLAIQRLARYVSHNCAFVEQAMGIQINRIACEATIAVLTNEHVSAEKLQQFAADLSKLSEFSGLADSFDSFERLIYLDSALSLKAGHADAWRKMLGLGDETIKVTRLPADWNIVLRRGNEFHDRVVAAARMPPGAARDAAVAKVDSDIQRMHKDVHDRMKSIVKMSEQERGEIFAELKISLFAPELAINLHVQDSANILLHLTRLVAELSTYRAEHGTFPEKLDELGTSAIGSLTIDPSNGKPFIYHRDHDGYLLHSRGPSGLDDQGSNEKLGMYQGLALSDLPKLEAKKLHPKIPAGADDIAIHVPRQILKLPTPPPPADER